MLCPGCQRTDEVTSSVNVDSPDRYVAADVTLLCPDCKFEMFEADTELIPQLRLLHMHNIITHAHCAAVHDGKPIKIHSCSNKDGYDGPYIYMRDLPGDCYIELMQTCREIDRTFDQNLYKIYLTNNTSFDRAQLTKLSVVVLKPDQELILNALEILKRLINQWVHKLDEQNIFHPENHRRLRNCKIPNYVASSNWDGINPYGDDEESEDSESTLV